MITLFYGHFPSFISTVAVFHPLNLAKLKALPLLHNFSIDDPPGQIDTYKEPEPTSRRSAPKGNPAVSAPNLYRLIYKFNSDIICNYPPRISLLFWQVLPYSGRRASRETCSSRSSRFYCREDFESCRLLYWRLLQFQYDNRPNAAQNPAASSCCWNNPWAFVYC